MVQAKYQYGTSPRKVDPNYEKKNRKNVKKQKLKIVEELPRQQVKISREQKKKQFKMISTVAVLFLLLLTISCRNSQIDKQFNNIQEQKKQLAALQKENEQLKVSIENSLNLNNIEKVAKEELGMEKLTSKQTVYVTLPKKDYVESASEKVIVEEEKSWFQEILDKIINF
jgi:cell division protein FtsL